MKRLAVIVAATSLGMLLVGLIVIPANDDSGLALPLAFAAFALAYVAVGALVAVRRPGHAVGWWMLAAGALTSLPVLAGQYAGHVIHGGGHGLPGAAYAALLSNVSYLPAFGVLTCLLLSFPSGRLPGWRSPAAAAALLTAGAAALAQTLMPGDLDGFRGTSNPLGNDAVGEVAPTVIVFSGGITVGLGVLAVASIFVRLRRTHGDEREQLKWLACAAALVVVGFGLNTVPLGLQTSWLGLLPIVLGLLAMPLSIGVAVLRYRLYDIDVVIKRTLVYATLTAVLLSTYLVLVLALRVALRPLTGESDLAVAASTLAVAALFRPVRGRVQGVVDRRFYRSRYDAVTTVEGFSSRLRDDLDLDNLAGDLRAVVQQTMQPAHVSLWLRSTP